jgi:hypothetical protein
MVFRQFPYQYASIMLGQDEAHYDKLTAKTMDEDCDTYACKPIYCYLACNSN